ncbi:MAG: Nitric oxide-responding transcriptional regulator Dnr (Crp/Fnr family) [uncultured Sulfurovum sp.]|uniref:Nitric oxide-responding transcriptional regulator Dnr (Crp/Fnr family) n=1 Tax=uncultured Sulfurovum sp. TaxID=269237 RepID=A0A6S6T3R2_9BACT|nr:MAG: Nitric oxide-responding transcriptional regulator Dnr (Crp/Fnr family) [uncultured Sulfurovum sp.]
MKKSLYVIILLMLWLNNSFALTRVDVQIIEARENIQYLGQKITTDYFLLYKRPNDFILKNNFTDNITEFEKNIQIISNITKNTSTLSVLGFYNHELRKIKKIAQKHPTKELAKELLTASETFIEGVISIASKHKYESSVEEEMLVHCKDLTYLIESISKYYMAFQIGLKGEQYDLKMETAIQEINKDLKSLSTYNYAYELQVKVEKIKSIWEHNQTFFKNLEETTFTNLLLSSNTYLKTLLIDLETYHKQKLYDERVK